MSPWCTGLCVLVKPLIFSQKATRIGFSTTLLYLYTTTRAAPPTTDYLTTSTDIVDGGRAVVRISCSVQVQHLTNNSNNGAALICISNREIDIVHWKAIVFPLEMSTNSVPKSSKTVLKGRIYKLYDIRIVHKLKMTLSGS